MRGVTRVTSGRRCVVRTLAFLFLATFVWIQLQVISLTGRTRPDQLSTNETLLALVPQQFHRFLKERKNASTAANETANTLSDLAIEKIRKTINLLNGKQTVHNKDAFGPLSADAPIIVVQVHARLTYLQHLIISLAQAAGIERALLIFSHDVWNEEINYLVRKVDFCQVMQIFYPHSIQTHPHSFPGEDPNDCPRDIKRERALNLKCTNAEHPDLYGHYREAKFTQPKHHWWWKANRVFDQLAVTRNHTGMVLFLEEDHYVAKDFLHVLRLMELTCKSKCERCNVLSLGTYLKTYNYYAYSHKYLGVNGALQKELLRGLKRHDGPTQQGSSSTYQSAQTVQATPSWAFQLLPSLYSHYQKADVVPWISSNHNMGMAFNRSTWNKLRECASQFCSYDDYNWDWSLQRVAQTCLKTGKGAAVTAARSSDSGLITMMMRAPRVFHIGECGVHHKKSNCESTEVVAKLQNVLRVADPHLFPTELTITTPNVQKKTKLRKGNGGWGDVRDHELCSNITFHPDFALP